MVALCHKCLDICLDECGYNNQILVQLTEVLTTIVEYFNTILFKDRLNNFNDIKIRKMNNCTGQCVENISYYKGTSFFVLELKPRYKNKIEFLNTLSHEMLHLWQQTIKHDNGKHNKLFFSFRNKFKKLNLTLSY